MKLSKKPPCRWHVICLGRTIAKCWKRYDAIEFKKLVGGPDCCKVKYVK